MSDENSGVPNGETPDKKDKWWSNVFTPQVFAAIVAAIATIIVTILTTNGSSEEPSPTPTPVVVTTPDMNILETAPVPTSTPIPIKIALQTIHEKRYMTAVDGISAGDWRPIAEPWSGDPEQKFTVECLSSGKIALISSLTRYLTATDGAAEWDWVVVAETEDRKGWEIFTIIDAKAEGHPSLSCFELTEMLKGGNPVKIALKTHHGTFITALNADFDWRFKGEATMLRDSEVLTITLVP